ncbi:hypothetical protein D1007_57794 [Hordeum vulgare]|nr:hypothetical protein D1007_57794 [Hordeum vulgare]
MPSRRLGATFSTLLLLAPSPHRSSSGMHALRSREDVGVIREEVVGGESDELTTTPEHATKDVECIDGVGEVGKDSNQNTVVGDLLNSVHPWRSPGEVAVAKSKEEVTEVPCTPTP